MNDLLREFIMLALETPTCDGGGIILFREFDDKIRRILVLVGPDDGYDLPKGHIDPGETPFQAALRETREEAGISNVVFPLGTEGHLVGTCVFFIGRTDDEPILTSNPETGKFEHTSALWLPPEDVLKGIDCWMRPAIEWALCRMASHGHEAKHLRTKPIQSDDHRVERR